MSQAHSSYHGHRSQAGFTLIELLVVILIIAILAAIAVPSYTSYVVRTKRVAAASCLSQYANYMERYYVTNMSYKNAVLPSLSCAGPTETRDYYGYAVANATSSAYTLRATPINAQLDRDKRCGALTLTQAGARGITGPGAVDRCW